MTMVDATVGKRVLHHLRAVYDDALEMMRTSDAPADCRNPREAPDAPH